MKVRINNRVRSAFFSVRVGSLVVGSVVACAAVLCNFASLADVLAEVPAAAVAAPETSALAAVRATIDEVVRIAELHRGVDAQKVRRTELRQVINPRFDFDEMAKRSLGAQWNQISEAEQKDFTVVFSELLARTYLSKVETVKPGMVSVDTERVDFPRASVKTSVKHEGDTFPIEYRLMNENGTWKVYDVIVENIGLVANYRNEFAGIIRQETFAGLLKRLHEKVA